MTERVAPTIPESFKEAPLKDYTPEEGRLLLWYADLQSKVGNPDLSSEEVKDVATEVVHLMRAVEQSEEIEESVRIDMIANVKRLDHIFVTVRTALAEFRKLQTLTRQRAPDSSRYKQAVDAAEAVLLDKRIPEEARRKFKGILGDYLDMVRSQGRPGG